MIQHPDVLARYGSFRGKGGALRKSLFATTGDIVVWADTDVRHWHHRIVYGTSSYVRLLHSSYCSTASPKHLLVRDAHTDASRP